MGFRPSKCSLQQKNAREHGPGSAARPKSAILDVRKRPPWHPKGGSTSVRRLHPNGPKKGSVAGGPYRSSRPKGGPPSQRMDEWCPASRLLPRMGGEWVGGRRRGALPPRAGAATHHETKFPLAEQPPARCRGQMSGTARCASRGCRLRTPAPILLCVGPSFWTLNLAAGWPRQ